MYKNKKIILVAFASNNLNKSAQRLKFQAEQSKFYDEIKVFEEKDLDIKIKLLIKKMIKLKKRGFGYWVWKPYLVLKVLKNANSGDIVNYVDVGCHILGKNKKRFYEYLDIIIKPKTWLLPFQYKKDIKTLNKIYKYPKREEYKFTKSDIFDYYNCFKNKKIVNTSQFWAGAFFIKKTQNSLNFMKEWNDIFIKRPELISDQVSKIKNHDGFIENRHDQSVFSILCKKKKIKSISAYECDWALHKNKRIWQHNKNSPILAKRDLRYNILIRFINRQKKNFKRIKVKLIG